jgi:xylulokinase
MAGLATSGTLTHWFRDQIARDHSVQKAFPALAEEAAKSPLGANGLLMLPYFSGERTPLHDVNAKGAMFGFNLTHTRGDMYRALIEGIAHGTRHVTDTFAELDQAPKRLLAVGGGTKNSLWLQATSDITGIDQIVCEKNKWCQLWRRIFSSYGRRVGRPSRHRSVEPCGKDNHCSAKRCL